ncbi:fluconazole resistance (FLU1) [Fusarium beomiforme]|uniref:Fluconazole resistance (FLU1) n=1 Tax=Fusarium beomiforme TaxID=44412 RepID=A0A9P5ALC6_9HYPO|nr:fluconazole resistance (FLU1) [Fusarium beomiforme]
MEVSKAISDLEPGSLVLEKKTSLVSQQATRVIVTFTSNDPENPDNWPKAKKRFVVFTTTLTLVNSTLSSSLPANAMSPMAAEFGIDDKRGNPELALPISLFLAGYVFGPLLFGPLSEIQGRKYVLQAVFIVYIIFTLACALAPNWPSMLVFRLVSGICSSSPSTLGGGIIADIHSDLTQRGRALTYFYTASICAPLIAPAIAAYLAPISWRWAYWFSLIFAGVTLIPLAFLPETFGPAILARRANHIRKSAQKTGQGNAETYAAIELEENGWRTLMAAVLVRPLHMLFTELIVAATATYIALAYSVYYMFFQTYPVVFKGIYKMSNKTSSFMYLPIAGGICLGLVIFFLWDAYYRSCKKAGRTWAQKNEYSRLPLACMGGPLLAISLFWAGWTARSSISWVSPMIAGIPFGAAQLLISIALTTYLGDCYGVYSASAMAAGTCLRNLAGAGLCLAAAPMYTTLGVGWASTLLGGVSVLMCAIPFVFIRYGNTIRQRSKFYQRLKAEMETSQSGGDSD